ncbi:MAG TPA: lipopolysaccharide assembly protein LapA domain-containing protein [Acetobacteraceae bacterium]|jgi:uncharacterized integral membrane protein
MRVLIALPFLLLLVLFALSNTQSVHLGLWPTDLVLDAPLSIVVLSGMAIAFALGALELWFSAMAARRKARRAEYRVRLLEAQVQELKARNATPAAAAPPRDLVSALLPADRRG